MSEPAIRTFALCIAYDGTDYAGWQVQPGRRTIQGELERAATAINGEPARILGSGRTDAGVHARGQVARFETPRALEASDVRGAFNAHLPDDVVVWAARRVEASFHPTGDAVWKRYRYTFRIAAADDPFVRRSVMRIGAAPDTAAMRRAAAFLEGEHDFAPFQKAGSPRTSTVRTIRSLDVLERGDYIHLDITGNGFLYGMVRNLAGTLLRAGQGSINPESVAAALAAGDRKIAGPSLPARGLCLMEVIYPDSGGTP